MIAQVHYERIVTADVSREGNLRLFQRTFLGRKQIVFHPKGEWTAVSLRPDGRCTVTVR